MVTTTTAHTPMTNRDIRDERANPRFIGMPLGFEAGDENLYRYVTNQPTIATDPSGLEWHHIIIQALWNPQRANPLPFSEVARAIFDMRGVGVIDAAGHVGAAGHGAYNAAVRSEVIAWLGANRINPAAMTEAQARQLVQHIRNSPIPAIRDFFARILTPAARAGGATAARTVAGSAARATAARIGSRLGNVARIALGPFSMALSEVIINPSSTASAANLRENTVMRAPGSPEIYLLPLGTIITPTGEIYIPGPGSSYVPPRGSVVVIGRVVGNSLRSAEGLRPDQVVPYSFEEESSNPTIPLERHVQ